jgi:small subunit ribosomal protein S2
VAEANKLGIPVVAIVDTNADPDVIKEARQQMPMHEANEDLEAETYSTDAGGEGDSEADRKRRRPRRKRRPKPEAIAARLKTDADGGSEAATTGAVGDAGA